VHLRPNVAGALCLIVGLCALALPARAGAFVYWDNVGTTAVARANLDGTSANQSFITGISDPEAIAVDGQHVYWANYNTSTIGRAST